MRVTLRAASRLLVVAAIVTSLAYWPAAVLIGAICALTGFQALAIATFGGTFGVFAGLLAWWLLAFALAIAYATCVFPWAAETDRRSPDSRM